jgi:hypothetical protein
MGVPRRVVATVVVGLTLAGGAGGAWAATHGSSAPKTHSIKTQRVMANAPAQHNCPHMGSTSNQTMGADF